MINKNSFVFVLLLLYSSILVAAPHTGKYRYLDGEVYRGWSVLVDGFSPLMSSSLDKDIHYYQLKGNVNLFDKFYPTLELGYAIADKKLDSKAEYTSSAPYVRFGLDYNLLSTIDKNGKAKNIKSFCYLGGRYASTFNNYEMKNISSSNDYWKEQNFKSLFNQHDYVGWFEFLFGVHINLYKGLTLGWSARVKTFLHSTADKNVAMWYVPGYGFSDSAAFEFNYTIGYTFGK